MSRALARLTHFAFVLVGVGGLVLAWVLYRGSGEAPPEDPELALAWTGTHPLADELRALHLVAAPLLVFALGIVWFAHAAPRLRGRSATGRRSGLALLVLAAPMVLSGPLLQVAESEAARAVWRWSHTFLGLAWCGVYVAHLVRALRGRGTGDQKSVR